VYFPLVLYDHQSLLVHITALSSCLYSKLHSFYSYPIKRGDKSHVESQRGHIPDVVMKSSKYLCIVGIVSYLLIVEWYRERLRGIEWSPVFPAVGRGQSKCRTALLGSDGGPFSVRHA